MLNVSLNVSKVRVAREWTADHLNERDVRPCRFAALAVVADAGERLPVTRESRVRRTIRHVDFEVRGTEAERLTGRIQKRTEGLTLRTCRNQVAVLIDPRRHALRHTNNIAMHFDFGDMGDVLEFTLRRCATRVSCDRNRVAAIQPPQDATAGNSPGTGTCPQRQRGQTETKKKSLRVDHLRISPFDTTLSSGVTILAR